MCPHCLKFSEDIDVLEPIYIWVLSSDHGRKCPTTVEGFSCYIQHLMSLMPCLTQVWGKYGSKKYVGRYISSFGKLVLDLRDGRANQQSDFCHFYHCYKNIVVTGRTYATGIYIPFLVLFQIRCQGNPKLPIFLLRVSDFSISISTHFFMDPLGAYHITTPSFVTQQKKCSTRNMDPYLYLIGKLYSFSLFA